MPLPRFKILRTGDPQSAFDQFSAREILDTFGFPAYLLGSSTKIDKCRSANVLARILYLTPGLFCPSASSGCLSACLGHSSGRMAFPGHAVARDKRTAFYLEEPRYFMMRLKAELAILLADARRLGSHPAVRLNGSSDIPWEQWHPDLFTEYPDIQFFDYTKSLRRMECALGIARNVAKAPWPGNYHLTFSAEACSEGHAGKILAAGGNVAVAFWPELPSSWCGFPVIDGETHDARFLDPGGTVVGLRAKGLARVDTDGFTARPCPKCRHVDGNQLQLISDSRDTHRATVHRCTHCAFELQARWKVNG